MAFVDELPPDELTVSHWTMVEFASVLGRHVRGGRIDGAFAVEVTAQFEKAGPRDLPYSPADRGRLHPGQAMARRSRSRPAGSRALHLAVARNIDARLIVTFDKNMMRAGRDLGLAMSSGIEWPRRN